MELERTKKDLKERFERIFQGCKVFAIQLNGFSHTIFYKDKENKKHIDLYSDYLSPCEYQKEKLFEDGVYRASNSEKAKELFKGYANCSYQCNAREIVFENHNKW